MAEIRAQAGQFFMLHQRTIRWAFWICALAVLLLSLLPGDKPMPTTGWDKADHLLAYAVMGALGSLAWPRRIVLVLMLLLVFGIVIEGLQQMTGYRTAELKDVIAEVIGLGLGGAFGWACSELLAAGFGRRSGRLERSYGVIPAGSRASEPGRRG